MRPGSVEAVGKTVHSLATLALPDKKGYFLFFIIFFFFAKKKTKK